MYQVNESDYDENNNGDENKEDDESDMNVEYDGITKIKIEYMDELNKF